MLHGAGVVIGTAALVVSRLRVVSAADDDDDDDEDEDDVTVSGTGDADDVE